MRELSRIRRLSTHLEQVVEDCFAQDRASTRESALASLVAALEASAAISVQGGEAPETWLDRMAHRHGARVLAEDALRVASDQSFDAFARLEFLVDAGYRSLDLAPDPLSFDPRTDIPSQRSSTPVPVLASVAGVGTTFGLNDETTVVAALVDVGVTLPPQSRGAHMSRLQEAIEARQGATYDSVLAAASYLADMVLDGQSALDAQVLLVASLKVPTTAAISERKSSIDVKVNAKVLKPKHGEAQARLSVDVGVMTACPCTLAYSRLKAEEVTGLEFTTDVPPTFTHSQPGWLELGAEGELDRLPSEDSLLDAVASSATLREAVLKRPDEHQLVYRSHRFPQFTEDLARSAAAALASRVAPDLTVFADARNDESIHPHRASASLSAKAYEFRERT